MQLWGNNLSTVMETSHMLSFVYLYPNYTYYYRVFSKADATNSSDWIRFDTPPLEDGWSSFHGSWNKSGYSLSFAPDNASWGLVNSVMLAWQRDTGLDIDSSPVIVNGTVYFGSNDGKVYAVDGITGLIKWSYLTGGKVWSTPAVYNGTVFAGADNGVLYALDAANGALKWSAVFAGPIYSSPVAAAGRIFFTARDGYLYAMNASAPQLLWTTKLWNPATAYGLSNNSPWIDSSPLVAYGKVFVGSYDNSLYSVDELSGAVNWRFATGSWVRSTPSTDSASCSSCSVFFGSDDHFVYSILNYNGALNWKFDAGERVVSSPAVYSNSVFFGSYDGNVYSVDKSKGTKFWSFKTGAAVESSPAVAQGMVFVGSDDNNFYALNMLTGQVRWKYATGSWVKSSPAVYKGLVAVGSLDGRMYAFGGLTECRVIRRAGPAAEKADMVFVSDNYANPVREDFFSDSSESVSETDGLLSVAPISANKAKFNIYAIYTGGNGYHSYSSPDHDTIIRQECAGLGGLDAELLVKMRYKVEQDGFNGGFSAYGRYLNLVSRINGQVTNGLKSVIVHEFGHTTIGGPQGDEYNRNRAGQMSLWAYDLDYEGCPKWCSGQLNTTVRLSDDASGKTCYQRYTEFKSCVGYNGGNETVVSSCLTTNQGLYFLTVLDYCDMGVGCRPGTGCYWMAGDAFLFRSSSQSVMRYTNYGVFFSLVQRESLLRAIDNFTPATTGYAIPYCGTKSSPEPCVDWVAGTNFTEGQLKVGFYNNVSLADARAAIALQNATIVDESLWNYNQRIIVSVPRGLEARFVWFFEKDSRVGGARPNDPKSPI